MSSLKTENAFHYDALLKTCDIWVHTVVPDLCRSSNSMFANGKPQFCNDIVDIKRKATISYYPRGNF